MAQEQSSESFEQWLVSQEGVKDLPQEYIEKLAHDVAALEIITAPLLGHGIGEDIYGASKIITEVGDNIFVPARRRARVRTFIAGVVTGGAFASLEEIGEQISRHHNLTLAQLAVAAAVGLINSFLFHGYGNRNVYQKAFDQAAPQIQELLDITGRLEQVRSTFEEKAADLGSVVEQLISNGMYVYNGAIYKYVRANFQHSGNGNVAITLQCIDTEGNIVDLPLSAYGKLEKIAA